MREVLIVAARRTPFGRFGGALRDLNAARLGGMAMRAALEQVGAAPSVVEMVILGNCMGAATLGQVPARQAAFHAGLPHHVPCLLVEQACTSGLWAVALAARLIGWGEVDVAVAGGMESMSNVPYVLPGARWGYRLGHGALTDALTCALTCPITGVHMGIYAGEVATEYGIGREAQDRWALRSQQRYAAALAAGKFRDEVTPVEVPSRNGGLRVDRDEQPRPDTTLEKLAALLPAFDPRGTVTAGNAPGLNDGAAALVLAAAERARALGWEPLARVVGWGQAAALPREINTVPAMAAEAALRNTGLAREDIALWEINEAFAAVTLTAMQQLGVDPERVNVNGGSVALGHPVGATGARLLTTLIYELRRRGGGLGLATLCGAGSHGKAVIVEAFPPE
ncbi:MAG: thiolase family protein [Anaerolineae bacterium]